MPIGHSRVAHASAIPSPDNVVQAPPPCNVSQLVSNLLTQGQQYMPVELTSPRQIYKPVGAGIVGDRWEWGGVGEEVTWRLLGSVL
ncbi:hypothetical protein TIFTF001_001027 [Ficus carica]|uniref:Uncharacterized protein n=1 Tax=Ficus carica TaxID=3494 RepID=A0AA88CQA0_FICCA|nr:hypothetical protein TIFTF001_001027 [Ficus carica]